jgi:lipopolysaccharide transport system ATP-binding protein
MAFIKARNLTLDFPIYGVNSRSLKNRIIKSTTGGYLAKNNTNGVTVRALDIISFQIKDGDRVGLIGNNGAGKSSLLRVMAGIYEFDENVYSSNGVITSLLSITLGMDMESTGIEFIYLRGYILGYSKTRINNLIDEIIDFADLDQYLYLPLRTYSSGMLMRLSFAISTSIESDIILMDEWLSVGDLNFINKANDRLINFMKKSSIIVLASHDYSLIKNQANRFFKLDKGTLLEISKDDF